MGPWRSRAPVPCTGCTNGSYAPGRRPSMCSVQLPLHWRIIIRYTSIRKIGFVGTWQAHECPPRVRWWSAEIYRHRPYISADQHRTLGVTTPNQPVMATGCQQVSFKKVRLQLLRRRSKFRDNSVACTAVHNPTFAYNITITFTHHRESRSWSGQGLI